MADKDEPAKAPETAEKPDKDEQETKRKEKLETHSSSHHTAGTAKHQDQNEDG